MFSITEFYVNDYSHWFSRNAVTIHTGYIIYCSTHVVCEMPLLMQHVLMSGRPGAWATAVGFIFPDVKVRVRTEYDGKLLPWMLRAVTDNSYIVYGFRSLTMVLLYVPGTWWRNNKYIIKPNIYTEVTRWVIQCTDTGFGFFLQYALQLLIKYCNSEHFTSTASK